MTVNAATSAHETGAGATSRVLSFIMAGIISLLLLPTWITFPQTWLAERTHGFAMAGYCLWCLYVIRGRLYPTPESARLGLLIALASGSFWAAALVIGIQVIHQAAAVAILLGLGLALYGKRGFQELWPLAAMFLLALPVWEILVGILQSMTVAVNHSLVSMFGIPAELERNLIHFPFGTIEVAQSCAGLSFLTSALTIGVIYAHQFQRHWKARVAAVLTAALLALISNWLRVFGLVVIGYQSKMKSPLMADHGFFGWIIFAVVMVVFFTLTGRIDRWEKAQPVEGESHAPELSSVHGRMSPSSVVGISTTAALPIVVYLLLSTRQVDVQLPEVIPGVFAPSGWGISELQSESPSVLKSAWSPAMIGAQFRQTRQYTPPAGVANEVVQLDRFGYNGNSQGHELIGYGNSIANGTQLIEERVVGPLDNNFRTVRQAILRTKNGVRLVWFWYRVADVETTQPSRAKLLELVAFIHRTTPSELVAVSAACDSKDCQKALEAVHLVATGRPLQTSSLDPRQLQ